MKYCDNCGKDGVRLYVVACDACFASRPDESTWCDSCIDGRRRINNHLACVHCERPIRTRWRCTLVGLANFSEKSARYAFTPREERPYTFDPIYFFAFSAFCLAEKYALLTYFGLSPVVLTSLLSACIVFLVLHLASRVRSVHFPANADFAAILFMSYLTVVPAFVILAVVFYPLSALVHITGVRCTFFVFAVLTIAEWLYMAVVVTFSLRFLWRKVVDLRRRGRLVWRSALSTVVAHDFVEV